VKAPPRARYEQPPPPRRQNVEEGSDEGSYDKEIESEGDADELSSVGKDLEDTDITDGSGNSAEEEQDLDRLIEETTKPDRKRKRKAEDEDLEGKYMQKLAREEEKEEEERQAERRLKRQRLMAEQDPDMSQEEEELDEDREKDDSDDEATSSEDDSGEIIRQHLQMCLCMNP
jgi:nucleolar protein 12